MNVLASYIHGSEDSLDVDIAYVIDRPIDRQAAKDFCDSQTNDANILTIENGQVSWCYKGTPDELNNSLLVTYPLHQQKCPMMITHRVERDVELKLLRALRCLLSHASRSELRSQVKAALRSDSIVAKLSVLKEISWSEDTIKNKGEYLDVIKSLAFQIGQTSALFEGVEVYTKSQISLKYPSLRKFLNREQVNVNEFNFVFREFLIKVETWIAVNNVEFSDFDIVREKRLK
jgi:hypothetical protein